MRDTKFRTRLFLCFLAVIVMTLVLPGLYVRKNIKEDGIDETVRNARSRCSARTSSSRPRNSAS